MVHLSQSYLVFAATCLITICAAHSNLGYPAGYNFRSCRIASPWCNRQACPPKQGKQRNTQANPAATWRRGQRVTITWHKNNHIGGFYRRSLVPVAHMYDHDWHAKTAFDWGCWSQGTFTCKGDKILCGGDKKHRTYRNEITIPSVFPNGDYVFAQVWFGGMSWKKTYPNHSDYFACSYVKIVGNEPVQKESICSWSGKDKTCLTGSTEPLQCGGHCGDACGGPKCPPSATKTTVPDAWRNGAVPKVVLANFNPEAAEGPESNLDGAGNPTPSETNGPLQSLRVFLNNEMVREFQDGTVATIELDGKDVAFEAYTGRKRVGTVSFKINEVIDDHLEKNPPYVFRGNRGRRYKVWPTEEVIFNEEFRLTVMLEDGTSKYELSVMLTLKQ